MHFFDNVGTEYRIGCPDNLKRRFTGLDQQGHYGNDEEELHIGCCAFIPVFLALALVGISAAVVVLLT